MKSIDLIPQQQILQRHYLSRAAECIFIGGGGGGGAKTKKGTIMSKKGTNGAHADNHYCVNEASL